MYVCMYACNLLRHILPSSGSRTRTLATTLSRDAMIETTISVLLGLNPPADSGSDGLTGRSSRV